ncbi:MAG TPA: hypothetical protein DEF45_21395 [Rhodopirellula sp.]|nr:hypothetical protein [Rhodopirellula sp.]
MYLEVLKNFAKFDEENDPRQAVILGSARFLLCRLIDCCMGSSVLMLSRWVTRRSRLLPVPFWSRLRFRIANLVVAHL